MNAAAEKVVPIDTDQLRERVRGVMEAEGLSQATVAKEAGLSSSVMSQWLAAEYNGDNNKVASKIVVWRNRREETRKIEAVMPAAPAWIEMPTARKIYDVLAYAQSAGDIGVVYGGAGLCKTTTVRHYQRGSSNVWLVTATPATANHSALLEEIAIALGLRDFPLHAPKLQRAIIASLHATKGLLIIDEAQHLTKQALETARSIYDRMNGDVGLGFSGNTSVYGRMYGGGNNGFAQLFSRVGKRLALGRPMAGDVHAMAAAFGIKGNEERQELEGIANRPGALRMVMKTVRLASVFAAGAAVKAMHIRRAYHDLQGELLTAEEAQS